MMGKQKVTETNMNDMLDRISVFTNIADAVKETDFVIETVPEIMDIKKQVFHDLAKSKDDFDLVDLVAI
jgi:3-hydroxyacyl-CoA dehydrogenase